MSRHGETPGWVVDLQICSVGDVDCNDSLEGSLCLSPLRKGLNGNARIIRTGQCRACQQLERLAQIAPVIDERDPGAFLLYAIYQSARYGIVGREYAEAFGNIDGVQAGWQLHEESDFLSVYLGEFHGDFVKWVLRIATYSWRFR